jgi:hypothetical protein
MDRHDIRQERLRPHRSRFYQRSSRCRTIARLQIVLLYPPKLSGSGTASALRRPLCARSVVQIDREGLPECFTLKHHSLFEQPLLKFLRQVAPKCARRSAQREEEPIIDFFYGTHVGLQLGRV